MTWFYKSLRWRLQAWHGLMLTVVIAGLCVTVYRFDYAARIHRVDETLQRRLSLLASVLPPGPPLKDQGPNGGPPGPDEAPGSPPAGQGPNDGAGDSGEPPPGPPGMEPVPGGSTPSLEEGAHPAEHRSSGTPSSLPTLLRSELGPGPHPPPNAAYFFEQDLAEDVYQVIWEKDGTVLSKSSNTPDGVDRPGELKRGAQITRLRGDARETALYSPFGRCVLVGRSIAPDLADLRRLALVLFGAGGGVLALGLVGGWWLATRAIRPIDDISATATRIAAGDLSQRIGHGETDTELGRLAGVLNSTFARLEAAFARQQRFTADASHELRTPLSVIVTEAQSTLARDRTAAEYRESLEACLSAAQQMRKLTQSLLELARFDSGGEPASRTPMNLAETAHDCLERLRPLASQRGIGIRSDLGPAKILGEPDRLGQLVSNLLDNALEYSAPNGEIRIGTRTENGSAILTVADRGIGIASEDLPHIFERFYRSDRSRARSQDHNGLGLSICKEIVEAHGGSIEAESRPDAGSTFTVRLPVAAHPT